MQKLYQGISITKSIIIGIISVALILALIFAFRGWVQASEIKAANEKAELVFDAAQNWILEKTVNKVQLTSTSTTGLLVYRSENLNSKRSEINQDNNFVAMDISNINDSSFRGDWYVVVNSQTLKVEYALWSKERIPSSEFKKLNSFYAQQRAYKQGAVIGCYPLE